MIENEIRLKAVFLTKALWLLVIVGVITSIIIYIFLEMNFTFQYLLSMLVVFSGILVVFFINRNEPEKIEIKKGKIKIVFFNKVFFKQRPISYSKIELNQISDNNIIKLFKDDVLVVNIRKEAVRIKDWEYFKTVNIREDK